LITPPIASEPQSIDCGPRKTSIRAMSSAYNCVKSNPPLVAVGSVSRMPSITTTLWLGSAPRIRKLVTWPNPPVRATLIPGIVTSTSLSATGCRWSSAGWSITVTVELTRSASTGVRSAETTMLSDATASSSARAAPGWAIAASPNSAAPVWKNLVLPVMSFPSHCQTRP
jgi:hypothetical protein